MTQQKNNVEGMKNNEEKNRENKNLMMNMMNNDENAEYIETHYISQNVIKICPICDLQYEANSQDQKICFSCYKKSTGQREIALSEIVLDNDHREMGELGIVVLSNFFSEQGYKIEIYKAEGQKSPHAHIKGIPMIADLPKKQNERYKELLIRKYISKARELDACPELEFIDFGLCRTHHLIAEEGKPHKKYGTIKELLGVLNSERENIVEMDIYNQAIQEQAEEYHPDVAGTGITSMIVQVINIKDIAIQFGLNVRGSKTYCPFHSDGKTPSLVFYEKQGRFFCFGCNQGGNIIKFYAMLKDIRPSFAYRRVKQC